jgi:Ca-activated chloride channel family protein
LQGENEEWVDAIVKLSVEYGIITPYTSFLIEERDFLIGEGQQEAAEEWIAEYSGPAVGAEAVEKADSESNLRSAESIQQPTLPGEMDPGNSQKLVKYVEEKTFLFQDGIWIDTAYQPDSGETLTIGFGSEAYFELLSLRPSWGKYLALGTQVIIIEGEIAYEIVEGEGELESLPQQLLIPEEGNSEIPENHSSGFPNYRFICPSPILAGAAILAAGLWKKRE